MGLAEEYADELPDSRVEHALTYLRHNYRAYLLLAPATLFLLIVIAYPVLDTIRLSLYQASRATPGQTFIGLANYVEIFQSDIFYQVLWQTARWVVVAVAGKTLLGLLIAVHLNHDIEGRKFFRTAFLIPWGIPYAISAVVFRWMQHPQYGYFNSILINLGVVEEGIGFLGSTSTAWLGVVMASVWTGTPFMAIVFLAGLQSIPDDLYEAAAVDGAGRWGQFRYVTIPQMKPVILIATLMSTIWTFVAFDVIWTMTSGGPANSTATLVIWIFQEGIEEGHFGLGAAYSVIGFLILIVFAILYVRAYTRGGATEL